MKACSTCKSAKEAHEFYADKRHRDGLASRCKSCHATCVSRWQANNANKFQEGLKRYREKNRALYRGLGASWRKRFPEKHRAKSAQYLATRKLATPAWLTVEQRSEIKWFYKTARELKWLSEEPLEVDHIEPLKGGLSCGLHVPWNLQIISASAHRAKHRGA